MTDKSFEHYVTVLPFKLKDNHHYYVRKTATLAEHWMGTKDGSAVLVGSVSNNGSQIKLYKAAEQINSHTPISLIGDMVYKLDNLNNTHYFGFIGFTKTSVLANGYVQVEKEEIEMSGWNLVIGETYLAGANGQLQIGSNLNSGFTQVLGIAQTTDKLLIKNNIQAVLK